MGVFSAEVQPDYLGEGRMLRWHQAPGGHHIELGISEMNLFLMLHALGLGHELHGEPLLPVGTVYDPFVCRGLDALIYGLYNGARFVVAGTPPGSRWRRKVERIRARSQHRSASSSRDHACRAGVRAGARLAAVRWLAAPRSARRRACTSGCRPARSTKRRSQRPRTVGLERLRADVLTGGYRLVEPGRPAEVVIAPGAVVPEVRGGAAARRRGHRSRRRGCDQRRPSLSSLARRIAAPPERHGRRGTTIRWRRLAGHERRLLIVTVHDGSHALAWLGPCSVLGSFRSASTSSVNRGRSSTSIATSISCRSRSSTPRFVALS